MKHYLRMELKRAFWNRRLLPALIFGFGLSVWHCFAYIVPLRGWIFAGGYPLSAYNRWLGGEYYSLQSTLFYLLVPIVCALPYGDSWLCDCAGSIGGQAVIRGGKRPFVQTKLLVSFLTGALIAVLPLLFDFVLTSAILPAIVPKAGLGLSPISTKSLLGDLFYAKPFWYVLVYLGINGLFFGSLNTLSIAAGLFTANRYMAILTPFFCYMALHCAGTTIQRFELCPSGFLRPCQQFITTWVILGAEVMGIWSFGVFAAFRYIREEHGMR